MGRAGLVIGWVVGLYFVARAAAEPFVIDMSEPESYAKDWGGPSLAGVLAVHIGPGILAAALLVADVLRRRSRRQRVQSVPK
jgi:hypothetical protein